ncbi:MAG TPA: hypothetical protein VGE27_03730 [Gemmatimonas sp.]
MHLPLLRAPGRLPRHRGIPTAFAWAVLISGTLQSAIATPPRAQSTPIIETVVPFDSAGRITTITRQLVSRLSLTAPAWPVTGAFREATRHCSA